MWCLYTAGCRVLCMQALLADLAAEKEKESLTQKAKAKKAKAKGESWHCNLHIHTCLLFMLLHSCAFWFTSRLQCLCLGTTTSKAHCSCAELTVNQKQQCILI